MKLVPWRDLSPDSCETCGCSPIAHPCPECGRHPVIDEIARIEIAPNRFVWVSREIDE